MMISTYLLIKAGGKSISLKVSDSHSSVNYMLSDVSVINKPPQMKQIPEFDLEIDVTPQFINKFIGGKGGSIRYRQLYCDNRWNRY